MEPSDRTARGCGSRRQPPQREELKPTGFPSPAADYIENALDLNACLVKHPAATYFVRAAGDAVAGAGIYAEDILVVDRAVEPAGEAVVIAVVDGDLCVRRIVRRGGRLCVVPANGAPGPVEIAEGAAFEIWGVVTAVIHRY